MLSAPCGIFLLLRENAKRRFSHRSCGAMLSISCTASTIGWQAQPAELCATGKSCPPRRQHLGVHQAGSLLNRAQQTLSQASFVTVPANTPTQPHVLLQYAPASQKKPPAVQSSPNSRSNWQHGSARGRLHSGCFLDRLMHMPCSPPIKYGRHRCSQALPQTTTAARTAKKERP